MRTCWIKWALNPMTGVLLGRGNDTETQRCKDQGHGKPGQRLGWCSNRGGKECQGYPEPPGRGVCFPRTFKESRHCFWTSILQACEKVNSCCYKSPSLCYLVMVVLATDTGGVREFAFTWQGHPHTSTLLSQGYVTSPALCQNALCRDLDHISKPFQVLVHLFQLL